jgi:hypothetical protein
MVHVDTKWLNNPERRAKFLLPARQGQLLRPIPALRAAQIEPTMLNFIE